MPSSRSVVDAFVQDGLWVTAPKPLLSKWAKSTQTRVFTVSVPTPAGAVRSEALRVPPSLAAGILAEALGEGPTPRLLWAAELILLGNRLGVNGSLVPDPDATWRLAATAEESSVFTALLVEARALGAAPDGAEALKDVLLEQALHAAFDAVVPDVSVPGSKVAARLWSERVVARRRSGLRLSLRLHVPTTESPGWELSSLLVSTEEASTQGSVAAVLASPSTFGTTRTAVESLVQCEQQAAGSWAPLRSGRLDRRLIGEEVLDLLTSGIPRLESVGIEVLAPASLLRTASLKRSVSVQGSPAGLTAETLQLDVDVTLDGEVLSKSDLERLVRTKEELVELGGRWVRLDLGDAERARKLLKRAESAVSAVDLGDLDVAAEDLDASQVTGWVGEVLQGTWKPVPSQRVGEVEGLEASLRPYQETGLEWLTWLEENALGGILADDMGLGKTLQVISRVLLDHAGTTLVVAPSSVVTNWVREVQRFAPDLRVSAYHGAGREHLPTLASASDVVVTTYGLLRSDPLVLEEEWHRVVLDEAQAVKNPHSATAKAARRLQAKHRLAVTGTPVENRLVELWSIMAFAQPGLLGSDKRFSSRYEKEASEEGLARLRLLLAPFLLRRVKSDPLIVPDLPEKVTIRNECGLSKEQIGLYAATVESLLASVDEAGTKTQRRGAVLAGIGALKQICVHPALRVPNRALDSSSGKLERLEEVCAAALAANEAVLVFTQFASAAPGIASHLAKRLGVETLHLTGDMTQRKRQHAVDQFNDSDGPPIFVISLKAGGTGLNLVRANHVVHLDRWWNPAVEDQASDRAWRIGQTRGVVVHNLVCPGTLEERIDTVLSDKRKLAGTVVTGTSVPVSELDRAALEDLVRLVREEVQ